jgi:UDP-N-acetylglucosamine--N-acetylmuramyl-(pentapeptide) pyrophosphoryl-undecaprenol N-acetylglucosamine transferase
MEREEGPVYRSFDFIGKELPDLFAAADIVVSRAGANTLWEIGTLGKASILIPLGTAGSRGDQIKNAEVFKENGAALVLDGEEVTEDVFLKALLELIEDKEKRDAMGEKAKSIANDKGAKNIAEIIIKMLERETGE